MGSRGRGRLKDPRKDGRRDGRPERPPPRRVRAAGRAVGGALRGALQGALRVVTDASWRRAAREVTDAQALRGSVTRLTSLPYELALGPDPRPATTRTPGRFARLAHYRPAIVLLVTLIFFAADVNELSNSGRVPAWLVVVAAGLFVLPLGLSALRPLLAWRALVVIAALAPFVLRPRGHELPWHPSVVAIGLYVLFVVAIRSDLRLLIGVWALSAATIMWSLVAPDYRPDAVSTANGAIVLVTVVLAFGHLVGARRRLQGQLAAGERRTKEEQARRALLEERARIARELHDVVAHHMSVIAVRAETAPFRISGLSDAARDDLAETSAIAREALTEMRRLLGVLRGADAAAERAPQPGLDRLETLVAGVQGAGLNVRVRVEGGRRPLPPGVELSAFRIVQEALSNALRHAPGAPATVEVGYEPDRLRLRVENEAPPGGAPAPPRPDGHGIIGMRERAAVLGGLLTTGPTRSGGYLVEALLPLDDLGGDDAPPPEDPPPPED